jgi:hypothetical protein
MKKGKLGSQNSTVVENFAFCEHLEMNVSTTQQQYSPSRRFAARMFATAAASKPVSLGPPTRSARPSGASWSAAAIHIGSYR